MKKRIHVFVSGRVQGVFFRQSTFEKAKLLGLCGWVRNTEDGRVEAVFEGEEERIKKILEWMKKGPPLAKVKKLEIFEEEARGEFKDFEIKFQ